MNTATLKNEILEIDARIHALLVRARSLCTIGIPCPLCDGDGCERCENGLLKVHEWSTLFKATWIAGRYIDPPDSARWTTCRSLARKLDLPQSTIRFLARGERKNKHGIKVFRRPSTEKEQRTYGRHFQNMYRAEVAP